MEEYFGGGSEAISGISISSFERKFNKRTLITMIKLRGLLDVASGTNLESTVRMYQ